MVSSPGTVQTALAEALKAAGGKNYIVSAGCEIPGDSPAENVQAMGDFAKTMYVF
jgi:uroporphyrinogen-III decarboxylase